MEDIKIENKRPKWMTVVCVLGFIDVLLMFGIAISNLVSSANLDLYGLAMPFWFSIFSMPWAIFLLVALIFIWKMRKVGLIAYTGLAVVQYVFGFIGGFVSVSGFIWDAIFIGLLWTQFKKMSWDDNDSSENYLIQNSRMNSVNVKSLGENPDNTMTQNGK